MNTSSQEDGDNSVDDGVFERIDSEEQDKDSSPFRYEINVYPADFTLEILNNKLKTKELKIPEFQRSFVWKQRQASKLVESFLLGLPVPPVFLYEDRKDANLLVVDGQQRLRTIQYFFEGFSGEAVGGKRPIFNLIGINEKIPFYNLTYKEISENNESAERKLKNTVLRSVIIKQLDPDDDTSIYHIFERLNTGGTPLTGQEIRNCIYHGTFNGLLHELNKTSAWRNIFGKEAEDARQRDIELILRFFALYHDANNYERPMKDFLSKFMSRHKNEKASVLAVYRDVFTRTVESVSASLGPKPFRLGAGINAALFDAVFTAFALHGRSAPGVKAKYEKIVKNDEFRSLVTATTTNPEFVRQRLKMARQTLFGKY